MGEVRDAQQGGRGGFEGEEHVLAAELEDQGYRTTSAGDRSDDCAARAAVNREGHNSVSTESSFDIGYISQSDIFSVPLTTM